MPRAHCAGSVSSTDILPGVLRLAAVSVPVQVLSSDTGSGPLGGWAAALAAALPAGVHRTLPGTWHWVPDDVLADAIRSFAAPLLAEAS